MLRLGILASGSGTNFQALAEACREKRIDAEVATLIVNVPGAGALARAEKLGVPATVIDHQAFTDRALFERELVRALQSAKVDLVCLAGFMRLVGQTLLAPFAGRILNIHPSLLPAFPGLNAVRQALEYRVALTGCTVHVVDSGTDTGPILLQAAVPVQPGDTEETLAARIHAQEHQLYPAAVKLFVENRVTVRGRTVRIDGRPAEGVLVGPVSV
ncbi:MAG: phosphoribosylglycinamide formyltransferase [Deltaproteobacteria bacterium]|nr:phosphoribosylglycinamide formyltransferase [Deltaproteobacteria bacterium]